MTRKTSATPAIPVRRARRPVIQPLESRRLMSAVVTMEPAITFTRAATAGTVTGLTPAQVSAAYGFSGLKFGSTTATGAGQTIAIVDAYNDPNIAADLKAFDTQFGLAAATLKVVNQSGGTSLPTSNSSWSEEIALDVEWAHAMAPGASLLLVEAGSSSLTDLIAGVNYARSVAGVSVVSMSWGSSEFSGETSYDTYFTTPTGHTNVTFVAASGDDGSSAGAMWPASSAHVLSVGGTALTLTAANAYSSESGWSYSGGGASTYEGRPGYQASVSTASVRSVPDVAYDASPTTGFAVYDSYGTSTYWTKIGGTSAGAPQWAAIVALANQGRSIAGKTALDGATNLLPTIYGLAAHSTTYSADFHDVTTGSSSSSVSASTGYDKVTGLGTPKVSTLVAALVSSSVYTVLTQTTVPTTTGPGHRPPRPFHEAVDSIAVSSPAVDDRHSSFGTTTAAVAIDEPYAVPQQTTALLADVSTGGIPLLTPAPTIDGESPVLIAGPAATVLDASPTFRRWSEMTDHSADDGATASTDPTTADEPAPMSADDAVSMARSAVTDPAAWLAAVGLAAAALFVRRSTEDRAPSPFADVPIESSRTEPSFAWRT